MLSYYAYGFGSKAGSGTESAQQAYLFFQLLTLVLSMACAAISHALLFYIYYRPSAKFADAFADSVKINVRIVFRLVLFSHVTYCCSLILIGFVYFPNEPFALGLCIAVFSALLACVSPCMFSSKHYYLLTRLKVYIVHCDQDRESICGNRSNDRRRAEAK
jgi:magnesium-transporting ATPase (P-type)